MDNREGRWWFLGPGPREAITSIPDSPAVRELLAHVGECDRLGALEQAAGQDLVHRASMRD
ncbi:hypothetical protein NE236_18565 [Actinoallomurus purpureus]|uniref:hypothetical protein n=1 Tax=Actinoallomurus purpureus TaxID=478114 RepID=UPI0020921FBC|nr:hypothetical protein [Actinoallomurus purpureus]MCO6006994.1 hypothetical protein [Actinoallomurus purpureus]